MKTIKTEHLKLAYEDKTVIECANITIPEHKISILIGANGCGKSTMLRSFARLLKPVDGTISLDGILMSSLSTKQIAKDLAMLPQGPSVSGSLTVRELVEMGRYPYQNWRNKHTERDRQLVDESLRSTELLDLADRNIHSLSGGQRQRVWIAMVLAQDTDIILLDEPTTFLDVPHQIEILDLLMRLNKEEKKTIVMVLHDLNLSCRYADYIIAIKDKSIYKTGTPKEVITKEVVSHVFNMKCEIISDPLYDTPMCIPYSHF